MQEELNDIKPYSEKICVISNDHAKKHASLVYILI